MKCIFFIFILNSLLFAEIVIVTNKDTKIDKLSKNIIQYLYLEKIRKVEDTKITPLLYKDKKTHEVFVNQILNKSIHQYNSYWARLLFTGRKAIPKRLTQKEILNKLKEKNTISYIKRADLKKYMKIIYEE